MSPRIPIPVVPIPIGPWEPAFSEMVTWPFRDEFVGRLLQNDLPQRIRFQNCRLWGYRDPQGQLVGLGSLVICCDWRELTDCKPHTYIPLLAVNPAHERRGHGSSILRHLIAEAAVLVDLAPSCSPALILDVYTASEEAIGLYRKNQFDQIAGPFPDSDASGKEYIVMACKLSVTRLPPSSVLISGAIPPPGAS